MREEAVKLANALAEKAYRLHHVSRTLRAYLDDPKMLEQWSVAHLVDIHLNRISLASDDLHGFIKNVKSKRVSIRADDPAVGAGRR